ncbi:MAG: hypothetical protein J6U44_00835 [Paludibacteraceae bacterium]|nr:hypothetical protein [Paludibacteraceae bacterium]MBO7315697.1 hypothetical protein [Paludibacteraceae bacterium]
MKKIFLFAFLSSILFFSCDNEKYCWRCTTTTMATIDTLGHRMRFDTICYKTSREIKRYERAHTNKPTGLIGVNVGTETKCEKY